MPSSLRSVTPPSPLRTVALPSKSVAPSLIHAASSKCSRCLHLCFSKKLKGDVIAVLRAEKDELESSLSKEKLLTLQLKQELGEAEGQNSDLCKELQSVRGQLAAEQSRCFKLEMQSLSCQQVMDEAEKEYKKVSDRTTESREAMKASYEEFMADAQASASRACKTSITELSQSFEKAVDSLRNRYGISSN